jgi:hypothetical protein
LRELGLDSLIFVGRAPVGIRIARKGLIPPALTVSIRGRSY